MTDDSGGADRYVRPATVEDLKCLLAALNAQHVDYLLIGGYALYTLGYERGTTDIDLLLRPTLEQGERTRNALLLLPDGVARDLNPAWFLERETIRVADAFIVDLMFDAGGESFESLLAHRVVVDFDGIPVSTLDLEGMLKTKQGKRDKDRLDRVILERALAASKAKPADE